MLNTRGIDIKGKTVCVSGSGNVAQYTVEKLISLGAKVVTMSDSDGYIYDPDGIDRAKLDYIMELKNLYRGVNMQNNMVASMWQVLVLGEKNATLQCRVRLRTN